MDKKVTRKQFLLSILSVVAIFAVSKVPQIANDFDQKEENKKENDNSYGNYFYGGNENV